MYLVQIELNHPEGGILLSGAAEAVADMDRVEHASVHSDTRPYPLLALYTRARSHLAAVAVAVDAWRDTEARPEFEGWRVVRVRAIRIGAEGDAENRVDWAPGDAGDEVGQAAGD